MNPYQRASPRTASPASNLQTNPTRTNNPRHSADRNSYFDNPPYNDRGSEDGEDDMASRGDHMAETDQRQYQKINQVIQNFFTKSALSIVSSRVILPTSFNKNGDIRQNKWFNVILDDSDELQLRLTEWKTMDAMAGQHPPLYIEVYLDISGLGHKQSLVVHDEDGKRWDVAAALNAAQPTSRASSRPARPTQIVIERWKIYVGDIDSVHPSDLTEPLPNVYKKAVVLFRGLYANLRLLPAFKYNKSMAKQPANHTSLKLNYRILNGASERPQLDTLSLPLCPSTDPITETAHIGSTNSPIGPLCISVEYRDACEFSVEDSESLLSDQFMGLDDTYLEQKPRAAAPVPGSLPVDKLNTQETPDVGGSKTEEDALSSGKGSATSSLQRGSDTLNDGEGGSSGEMRSEDDNISDFLKLLEAKKDLKSFNRSDSSTRDATMRKTTAQLGKYQRMRDSHAQLSDSVSSSTMLHRSSSSSSRQLSSVPAMIHGTSISTASSPGKPISPHTPHTPAIPSRLSANSIIEYDQPHRSRNHRSRSRSGRTARGQGPENLEEQSEVEDDAAGIDIPLSPRPWNYQRRSSSVAQQNRNLPEDEPDMFGVRAASLPVEEGDRARDLHRITSTDLTSSGLFAQTESLASASRDNQAPDDGDSRDDLPRASSTSNTPAKRGTYSSNLRGRGGFFSQGSSTTGSTGGTSSTERQSRYNFNSRAANLDDDEPLLFQMSEIGAGGSRRSLEEARGGSSTGSARGRNSPWGGR
ncbi:hypothetical protein SNOG_06190 [Parastagonospora nodorum SN15]|uniref:hypothetical protein n=1 Tax=Phaeosphaeria nodorum (strain SN15 / ATCC MYA-4574 / FGSC 10173) TaxID=321614 RepID=UPI000161A44E|nr:hypothetical protein SNOG_06190 [Parastagonospora nodorum SN15]EAT86021.2 hypothetical protein SNOG_06190 [Parastagonospora nodorum SN15]